MCAHAIAIKCLRRNDKRATRVLSPRPRRLAPIREFVANFRRLHRGQFRLAVRHYGAALNGRESRTAMLTKSRLHYIYGQTIHTRVPGYRDIRAPYFFGLFLPFLLTPQNVFQLLSDPTDLTLFLVAYIIRFVVFCFHLLFLLRPSPACPTPRPSPFFLFTKDETYRIRLIDSTGVPGEPLLPGLKISQFLYEFLIRLYGF
jgi:hypothetical protein